MKKYGMTIAMSCLLALSLTGCGSAGNQSGGSSGTGNSSNEPVTGNVGGDSNAGNTSNTGNTGSTDGQTSSGGDKTIVFKTFWKDARYEEAKKKYEALHPNIHIKLEQGSYTDKTLMSDMEKYVKTMNTAMLAGKGPDLLDMDLLPADNYVKHKLLADLVPLMDKDASFKKDEYFNNILDNVRVDKALYSMPLSFFLTGFQGDEDAIVKSGVKIDDSNWSWNDFIQTAEQLVAKSGYSSALTYGGPEYLLSEMVNDNYQLFIDSASREAHFDTASFTGLMKQVKSMFDSGIVTTFSPDSASILSSEQFTSPRDYLESLQLFSKIVKQSKKGTGEHVRLYAKPHAQDTASGGYFKTFANVSIGANSKVKAEAWDFVKFLMSEEIQSSSLATGFPINKAAYAKQIQALKDQGTIKANKDGQLQGLVFKVDGVKLDQLETYVNGAVHQVGNRADKITEIVINETKAFFAGQKSADDVAALIQNKVKTYLNE